MEKCIIKRGRVYYYRRRVPAAIRHLETRNEIILSLKTPNKNEAVVKAEIYNKHIEHYWQALVNQNGNNSEQLYQAAVQLAKAHGFAYKTTGQIAAASLSEIVQRLDVNIKTRSEADALLGAVPLPQIPLSSVLEKYWHYTADRNTGKPERQLRKWRNPRRLAMENFIQVVGDKMLDQVTREDVLKFKAWWLDEIKGCNVSGDTGNKKLRHLKDILHTVANQEGIELDVAAMFANTRFDHTEVSRPPFEPDYVQTKLLPSLATMKHEYQMIIHAMADTGAREAEILGLAPEDIYLNVPIPYIHIRPRPGYTLKTATSDRKIPLVGVALYSFKQYPTGFNHVGNPDSFSTAANKFLKENNLKPTPKHSVYSLRHTFKDRLRDIGAPEEIIDDLMGHKKSGPKYGRGHKIATKHGWLQKIAYKVV